MERFWGAGSPGIPRWRVPSWWPNEPTACLTGCFFFVVKFVVREGIYLPLTHTVRTRGAAVDLGRFDNRLQLHDTPIV